jgi:endonuclease/exonuclease/phosphatase family metal-dependent hydrolase
MIPGRFFGVTRRNASKLLLTCWSLGLLYPHSCATSGEAAESQSLTFCAYNVKNWLLMDRYEAGIASTNATKPDSEKTAVITTLLSIRPDVLGLSEIGTAEDLAEIQARLKKEGLELPHSELAQGGDANRRLGLLSLYPITSRQSQTDLTYELDGQTVPVQRGFLDVTIEPVKRVSLRFIGVHLKSMREIPQMDQALMRRHEAALLRQHLDTLLEKDPNTALLLYGDFNEHRHETPIATIQGSRTSATFIEDIRVRDSHGQTWTHYWELADSYSRLDYFFVNRTMKARIDLQRSLIHDTGSYSEASDHRPIVTVIKLDPPKQKSTKK